MIIRFYKNNLAYILSMAAIIIAFTKAQDVIINNLGWLLFFIIVVLAMSYVVDNIYNYLWMKHTIPGKLHLAAKLEKEREAEQFGRRLVAANHLVLEQGDWSAYNALTEAKHKQIANQNTLLFNRWLKTQLGKDF
jgi:hypothetical protein